MKAKRLKRQKGTKVVNPVVPLPSFDDWFEGEIDFCETPTCVHEHANALRLCFRARHHGHDKYLHLPGEPPNFSMDELKGMEGINRAIAPVA
jgi:hypothetical protein